MPITAARFRRNYLTQIQESIFTGLSIEILLSKIDSLYGNAHVDEMLIEEYSDDGEYWSIESLSVDTVLGYLEAVNQIVNCSNNDLSILIQRTRNNNNNKMLRNVENLRWHGNENIQDLDIGLLRLLAHQVENIVEYLGNKGVVNADKQPLSSLDDWKAVHSFISSMPISNVCLDSVFLIIEHSKKHHQLSAIDFLANLSELQENIDLSELLELLKFSKNVDLHPVKPVESSNNNFSSIVEHIVNAIHQGNSGKWIRPWANRSQIGRPINFLTRIKYKGINTINLWFEEDKHGFDSPYWATDKQWKKAGYEVNPDETPAIIFCSFKKRVKEQEKNPEKPEETNQTWGHRAYKVFNACQLIDYAQNTETFRLKISDINIVNEQIDEFVSNTKAEIKEGGDRAFYSPSSDFIRMPPKRQFINTEQQTREQGYYSTLLHELTHWTGHTNRLNRKFGLRSDKEKYAFEELVAELGATFLCADFGLIAVPREQIDDQFELIEAENSSDGAIESVPQAHKLAA